MGADLPYIDQGKASACALDVRRAASGRGRYALWEIESRAARPQLANGCSSRV